LKFFVLKIFNPKFQREAKTWRKKQARHKQGVSHQCKRSLHG